MISNTQGLKFYQCSQHRAVKVEQLKHVHIHVHEERSYVLTPVIRQA